MWFLFLISAQHPNLRCPLINSCNYSKSSVRYSNLIISDLSDFKHRRTADMIAPLHIQKLENMIVWGPGERRAELQVIANLHAILISLKACKHFESQRTLSLSFIQIY